MSAVTAQAVALTGSDQTVKSDAAIYRGFALRETSGSATATVRIYDGTSASGTLLDSVQLAAGESAREWYGDGGIKATTGIYVDVVSGAVEGSLRVG